MQPEQQRGLLKHFRRPDDIDHLYQMPGRYTSRRDHKMIIISVAISSVISIALTLALGSYVGQQSKLLYSDGQSTDLLPALELPPMGPVNRVFEQQSIFREPTSNATNAAWNSLFPLGKGYISLDLVATKGSIPGFLTSQSTDGSGRFCVAVFHQLHCLRMIYDDFYAALESKIAKPNPHTIHCFDYLRASTICAADTTLEPFKGRFDGGGGGNGVDGFGSVHQCRDFEKVFQWSERFRYNDDSDAERFEG